MNLIDMNANDITICIEGKDIEMKYPICFGKVHDKWLVSRCGKVWSLKWNKLLTGAKSYAHKKDTGMSLLKKKFLEQKNKFH